MHLLCPVFDTPCLMKGSLLEPGDISANNPLQMINGPRWTRYQEFYKHWYDSFAD